MEGEAITSKEEIRKIIDENILGKKLYFTPYYYLGIDRRDIPHERVKSIFSQFDKIFAIEKEVLKYGDTGYELFYRISGNISFSIAVCPKKGKLVVIHAIEFKRSLQKRFPNIKLK